MIPYCHVLLHEDMLPNKSIYQGISEPPVLCMDKDGLYWMKNMIRQSCTPFVLCDAVYHDEQEQEIRIEHMNWKTYSYRNRIYCVAVDMVSQHMWLRVLV